jgi:hypothetical protein
MGQGDSNMSYLNRLEQEVCSWPNVTAHPHRFGGKEFRFGKAEIGHIHQNGTVDIPFPRTVRDALLEEGQAEEHRWVPNSGWATYRIRGEADFSHAANLMRISYLRYALKAASDPNELLLRESEALHLSPRFVSLLERFAPCPA